MRSDCCRLVTGSNQFLQSRLASLYFQANKGTALGWCPNLWLENIPNAQEVSPAVSAARFPLKP
jgi:hypothetical protein